MAVHPTDEPHTGFDALPYWQAYRKLGLNPIPIVARTKLPPAGFDLKSHYHRLTTDAEIQTWKRLSNVGLVMGGPTPIVTLDIDYYEAWLWLQEQRDILEHLLKRTWVVTSGSGRGGHIYVKSGQPVVTQRLSTLHKKKLGEIRGNGSYVVAPPSIHETGGVYTTLYGSPASILQVPDANALFHKIIDLFTSAHHGISVPSLQPSAEHRYGYRILPPSDGTVWKPKWQTLTAKARRALTEPAVYGEGEWVGYPSNSEIRYMIVGEMVRADWTIDEIEQCFADQPFGEYHYRNEHDTPHGRYVLETDVASALADWEREKAAAVQAIGPGWKITHVVRRQLDNPTYTITFELEDGRMYEAVLRVDDMLHEKRFQGAVCKTTGWTPQLQPTHYGRNMTMLMAAICDMAETEIVPEISTVLGYIKSLILQVLIETENHHKPDTRGLGWRDETSIFVRGGILMSRITNMYRAATLEHVSGAVERLGGHAFNLTWGDGQREMVWVIPKKALTEN